MRKALLSSVVLAVSVLAATLVILAPTLPEWTEDLAPDQDSRTLRLRTGESVRQSVEFTRDTLDAAVVWVDPAESLPSPGSLQLTAQSGSAMATALAFAVESDGMAAFMFTEKVELQERVGELVLTNVGSEPIYFRHHLDDTKYTYGSMVYEPNTRKIGDVAFQLRYARPALGAFSIQGSLAALIIITGAIVSAMVWRSRSASSFRVNRDTAISVGLCVVVAVFYVTLLLRPGIWVGPSDFTKDVSYVKSSSEAVLAGSYPAWSYYTCGGMGMLGNPEGNTLSLATLVALATDPEHALWIVVSLEAGIAAAGAYVLARVAGLSRLAGLLSAAVVGVSPTFMYRLGEGFTMLGGIFAFTPWILAGFIKAQTRLLPWALLSGLLLTFSFWRGDVHAVPVLILMLLGWSVVLMWQKRSWQPLIVLLCIGAVSGLGATPKLLAYFEQPVLIDSGLDPHVVLLGHKELWDDVLLKLHKRTFMLPVRHGLPEHYGYAGTYVGVMVLVLVAVGVLTNHRYRWPLLISAVITVLIMDGVLYDQALRHIPLADAIFRMPSRHGVVLLPVLGLFAAIGLNAVQSLRKRQMLAAAIVLFVVAELGWHTARLAQTTFTEHVTAPVSQGNTEHIVHENGAQNGLHASQVLTSGNLLPRVCGDQNAPPEFLAAIDRSQTISDQAVSLSPNVINWSTDSGSPRVARIRYTSSWQADAGIALPTRDGSIRLVSDGVSRTHTVRYSMVTMPAQKLLLVLILVVALVPLLQTVTRWASKKRSGVT